MSSSCWAGALHSSHANSAFGNSHLHIGWDGMSLVWSRGKPLLVTRPADMCSSRKERKGRQVQTNDQKQNSVSKMLHPGHSWEELAVFQSEKITHHLPRLIKLPRLTHSLRKHLVGVRHMLWTIQKNIVLIYLRGPQILSGIRSSINKHTKHKRKCKAYTHKKIKFYTRYIVTITIENKPTKMP